MRHCPTVPRGAASDSEEEGSGGAGEPKRAQRELKRLMARTGLAAGSDGEEEEEEEDEGEEEEEEEEEEGDDEDLDAMAQKLQGAAGKRSRSPTPVAPGVSSVKGGRPLAAIHLLLHPAALDS